MLQNQLSKFGPKFGLQYWHQFKLFNVPFTHIDLKYYLQPFPVDIKEMPSTIIKEIQKSSLKHELFISKNKNITELYSNSTKGYLSVWYLDCEDKSFLKHKFVSSCEINTKVHVTPPEFPMKHYDQRVLYALHDSNSNTEKEWLNNPVVGFHCTVHSKK